MKPYAERLYNGIVKENPVFVLMLGMCPTLAVTTSAINGLGMGLGFTVALVIIGSIREMLGAGSIFGVALPGSFEPIAFFVRAPGAFLVLAVLVAIMNAVGIKTAANKKTEGCDGCCASCSSSCDKKEG